MYQESCQEFLKQLQKAELKNYMCFDTSKDDIDLKQEQLKSLDIVDLFFLSEIEKKVLIAEKSSLISRKKEQLEIYKNQLSQGSFVYQYEEKDSSCKICMGKTDVAYNQFITCSECKISVHQNCYVFESYPTKQWVCDYCDYKKLKPETAEREKKCILCKLTQGPLRLFMINKNKTKNYSVFVKSEYKKNFDCYQEEEKEDYVSVWIHSSCIYFN